MYSQIMCLKKKIIWVFIIVKKSEYYCANVKTWMVKFFFCECFQNLENLVHWKIELYIYILFNNLHIH